MPSTSQAFFKGALFAFLLVFLPGLLVVKYYDVIAAWLDRTAALPVFQTMTDDFQTGRQIAGEVFLQKAKHFYELLEKSSAEAEVTESPAVSPEARQLRWEFEETRRQLDRRLSRRSRGNLPAYLEYIVRYKNLAQAEMRHSGIPASITIAQGLLESNAGRSRLVGQSNNHFGIKCRARNARFASDGIQDHDFRYHSLANGCVQCRDDVWWDRFETYPDARYSYRRHSNLLTESRYAWMLDRYHVGERYEIDRPVYGRTIVPYYAAWAVGLKKSGYATSRVYAEHLILIIETYQLWRLDYEVVLG